jgi:purine-binding chemotaxis protein CheW
MVSLVKARKKAKERKEEEAAAATVAAHESLPAAEEPRPEPEAKAKASAPKREVQSEPVVVQTKGEAAEPRFDEMSSAAAGVPASPSPAAHNKLEEFKRTANQLQTTARATSTEAQGDGLLELLLFAIAGEQYALPIEKIIEIISPRNATRVPNADDTVVGIISLRGTIVSILDIRRKLGHASLAATTDESRIIVVESDGETAGFLVDRVLRVVRVEPSEVESHPVVTSSEQSEFIRGVFQHAQKLSILLDLERLLRF